MTVTTEDIVASIRRWSINQIDTVESINPADAIAIYDEFREWINPKGDEMDIVCIESEP